MRKAMITIEVLVSMLILFLVISTSFSNIKFFNLINKKKVTYENQYINVLSIKDKLSFSICKTQQKEEGIFNGYTYIATCKKEQELRAYTKATEYDEVSGNNGSYMIELHKVILTLKKENFAKEYNYDVTLTRKLNP